MTLGDVHLNKDGTIRFSGDAIGYVSKGDLPLGMGSWKGSWRAQVGDPERPEEWPSYRSCYGKTRKAAVSDVLADLEHPDA